MNRALLISAWCAMFISGGTALWAEIRPGEAAAYFDFREGIVDRAAEGRELRFQGAKITSDHRLEFTGPLQWAEMDEVAMDRLARRLDGIRAMSVGGWFSCRRSGEQCFFARFLPEIAPFGERIFRPRPDEIDFCLGTDQHGFFMAAVHGNGMMPFPLVTLNEVKITTWCQLVAVKDERGVQKFFQNGTLVHTDEDSAWSGKAWPFREKRQGPRESVRLMMPLGGSVGEAWIFGRELSAAEIERDWEAKRGWYRPAPRGQPVALCEMDSHPASWLWKEPVTAAKWPEQRARILRGVEQVFGRPPQETVPLAPQILAEEDCGKYRLRKVSFAVQPDDRMVAYLLIPKGLRGRAPAIICFYGTTGGAGKETTVGRSGPEPGTPPRKNRAFALDMVEAGFVALAPDYLRDGERIKPGRKPYDATDFYRQFPDWSIMGKDAWDNSRAVDYLQTLDCVDADRIGMIGHSYGGHSTIFAAALEPRIRAAVANGPVSAFREHGMHWAASKDARSSQSLPGMRPYILDPDLPLPVTFYEFTSLIAPRPLLVGQGVGERRPMEEENCAAVGQVYRALGCADRVSYVWYPGDHDFPPAARKAAVDWFCRWLGSNDH